MDSYLTGHVFLGLAGDQSRSRFDQDVADRERRHPRAWGGRRPGHREEGGRGEPSRHRGGVYVRLVVFWIVVVVCPLVFSLLVISRGEFGRKNGAG